MAEFRLKVQQFLSNTKVVVIVSVLCFFALMIFVNFIGIITLNNWDRLLVSLKAGSIESNHTDLLQLNPFRFSARLKWLYLIGGFLSLMCSVRLGILMKNDLTPLSNAGQKGSRQFASVRELKREYRSVPEKKEPFEGKGGFPISRYKDRIFIDDSPVHNLIIGTTRSGKGELFVIPAIDIYSRPKAMKDKASMVIADPKGELAAASKEELERRGYRVHVFDLLSFLGMSFNPLQLVLDAYLRGDRAEAQLLTNTLSYILFHDPTAKDKTWENWSIALTNALILSIVIDCCKQAEQCSEPEEKQKWYDKINMYSVARLLIDMGEPKDDGPNQLDLFFASRSLNDIARIQYASVAYASGKTKGNIFANTLSQLIKFTMEPIAKMTSRNSVNLEDIGFHPKYPTAVFLVMPDYDTSNHFLVTMFISQLYYTLSKKSSMTEGGKCTREVIFLLDEFGNITPIPDMAHILTVSLGRNIRFDLIIQAYSQIYKLYGEQDGKTIIGNCGNQIYLLTIEESTAKQFSSLIGNKTITVISRSGNHHLSLDKKISEHIDTQPLLNPNQLMEFKPGESAVVRIIKRTDLKGRKIHPNPIYNHDETIMKYRYEYLGEEFNTGRSFQSLNLSNTCQHKNISLEDILYVPPAAESSEPIINEATVPEEPMLDRMLSEQQKAQIRRFFAANGFDEDTISFHCTLSDFDAFVQKLLDEDKISQQTFDDIYTVVQTGSAVTDTERSEKCETET
ncbi:MAG: Type VI secretion protein [Oscillospiraceae bacterium]|jgi:type IV secretion system protein VirD4